MALTFDRMCEEIERRIKRLKTEIVVDDRSTTPAPHIVDWSEKVSGLFLDDWQKAFLMSDRSTLFNCSRQVGKTVIVSLKAAYKVKFTSRRIVALAPTLR